MAKLSKYRGGTLLKCADLGGKEALVTIESIEEEEVGEDKERKLVARFEDRQKGLVLNDTNLEILELAFGDDSADSIGAQVILFVDPDVRFGGKCVGGVRLKLPGKKKPAAKETAAPAEQTTAEFLDDEIPF